MRTCKVCGVVKKIEEMSVSNRTTTKIHYRHMCKDCNNKRTNESYHLRKANPYPEDGYKCPICLRVAPKYHLDHDWESGKFRAWLCLECNVGLGHFRDSVDILNRALGYLTSFK